MIDISYKEISKIIELIDFEVDRIEKVKGRSTATSLAFNGGVDGETNDIYSDESSRYQKEIDLLNEIKGKYEGELNKVVFKFGAKDYNNEHKQENKPNGTI